MDNLTGFVYVDGFWRDDRQSPRRWERVSLQDIESRVVRNAGAEQSYVSVQRFKDSIALRDLDTKKPLGPTEPSPDPNDEDRRPDQQLHYAPLYFDFDADHQKLKVPHDEAIAVAQADACKVISFFRNMEIPEPYIQVWFSGRKGFHLTIHPEALSIKPYKYLTYVFRQIRDDLVEVLGLKSLDANVYSIPRMWRVPNTRHVDSKLYKVELFPKEMWSLTSAEIIDLAKEPRVGADRYGSLLASNLWEPAEYQGVVASKPAATWFNEYFEQYVAMREIQQHAPRESIKRPDDGSFPVCMQDMLANGPKPSGPNRNRVILPIVSFFKDAGLSEEDTKQEVHRWTELHYKDPSQLRVRLANATSVVKTAYRSNRYHFRCRDIRANSGKSQAERVACVGEERCPWIQKKEDQEPDTVPFIRASESFDAPHHDQLIRTAVRTTLVGGAYGMPLSGKVECTPNEESKVCQVCPIFKDEANRRFQFSAEHRTVLKLVDVSDGERNSALKAHMGIPKTCPGCQFNAEQSMTVYPAQMIEAIEPTRARAEQLTEEGEFSFKRTDYKVLAGYYLGEGLMANKQYFIDGRPRRHPKDQKLVMVWDKMTPVDEDIEHFKLTPGLIEQLKMFRPADGQSIADKLQDIHTDFESNVHKIRSRHDLSFAVDLSFHSVISFRFAGQVLRKGWFELMVVGDTGTGKSTLVERLLRHYGVGEMTSGENAKRTSLAWAAVQMGDGKFYPQWGLIPNNDRRLLVIDEFSGLPREEIAKLTQIRSEGVVNGAGVINAYSTNARTRLIMLTNPRDNQSLQNYPYGVLAFADIFGDPADLRRLDLGVTMRGDEVPAETIHQRWAPGQVPHRYTADLCKQLILWAWSREPAHVVWDEGAENEVFEQAKLLGTRYECDISLSQQTDMGNKIARMSVALAARLFSTDENAHRVHVKKEHVAYIAEFIDQAYKKDSMGFYRYAQRYKSTHAITGDRIERTLRRLRDCEGHEEAMSFLSDATNFTRFTFGDAVPVDRETADRLWRILINEKLIKPTAKGFTRTEAAVLVAKRLEGRQQGQLPGVTYHTAPPSLPQAEPAHEATYTATVEEIPAFDGDIAGDPRKGDSTPF